ncbi:MAG: type II 3-dehydroquinate dehydratase [Myxococcales bacterium]|nr:type II 3-dehydroquinate dehydratase [Myxococcales bacterium]
MSNHVAVIHGPNLNLLGTREKSVYGDTTLAQLDEHLLAQGESLGVVVSTWQSNHEGAIVDHIQSLRGRTHGIVINAGAYTHTSVAIRDALLAVDIPFVEVHISNVFAREKFRHHSWLSDRALGVVTGLGVYGYEAALRFLAARNSALERP